MAVINGSDLYVFLNGVRIAHSTSHSIRMKMATRDTSIKDTGKFNTKGVGRMDITATSDNLLVDTDFATLFAAYLNRTVVAIDFGQQTGAVLTSGELIGGSLDVSEQYLTGNFIITGLDQNAGDQANASYTVSFDNADGSFALTPSTTLRVMIAHRDCMDNAETTPFTGSAYAMAFGGTNTKAHPYTYAWSGTGIVAPTNLQYIIAQPPGTYTCVVTGYTSSVPATASAVVVIGEPAP